MCLHTTTHSQRNNNNSAEKLYFCRNNFLNILLHINLYIFILFFPLSPLIFFSLYIFCCVSCATFPLNFIFVVCCLLLLLFSYGVQQTFSTFPVQVYAKYFKFPSAPHFLPTTRKNRRKMRAPKLSVTFKQIVPFCGLRACLCVYMYMRVCVCVCVGNNIQSNTRKAHYKNPAKQDVRTLSLFRF